MSSTANCREEGLGEAPTTGSDTGDRPSEDEVFQVLANRRRRYTVHALKRADGRAEIGDIAEQVAAWEYDTEVDQVSYDERKRVYTALQQSHLPSMAEAGIVEFDKNRGVVEQTPALDEVDVYLEVVRDRDIPWSEYYLGLSAVAAALMAAVAVNAWPFRLLPDLAWGIAVAVAFAVSAVVHTYFARDLRVGETDRPPELEE